MDKSVDTYIEKQKSQQKEVCKKLRKLIIKTFSKIQEEMKMGVSWYEGKFYIVVLKDHVNLGFSLKGLTKKELSLFQGTGKTMKNLQISSTKEIDEDKITSLLKLVGEK